MNKSKMKDAKRFEVISQITVYCPNCGHSLAMSKQTDIRICNWCGVKVYRTKEIEFKEKLKVAQIRSKKND